MTFLVISYYNLSMKNENNILKLNIISIDGERTLTFDFDKSNKEKSFNDLLHFLYENDEEKDTVSFKDWCKQISFKIPD